MGITTYHWMELRLKYQANIARSQSRFAVACGDELGDPLGTRITLPPGNAPIASLDAISGDSTKAPRFDRPALPTGDSDRWRQAVRE